MRFVIMVTSTYVQHTQQFQQAIERLGTHCAPERGEFCDARTQLLAADTPKCTQGETQRLEIQACASMLHALGLEVAEEVRIDGQ